VKSVERLNNVAETHRVDSVLKHAVNHHHLRRRGVQAEFVRGTEHIRRLQRRAHGSEGVRHVVA
jgi:hypothetical protein